MAPPQVDLTKKQPLEDVEGWAEKVCNEKPPPKPPAYVSVETSTTVAGKRTCGKRRCKKLIIGMIIGAVVAAAITAGIFVGVRRHHWRHGHWKGHVEEKGHHGEEDIRTEGSKRLIYITRNETNFFFKLYAVLDYETQLAGFKDCSKMRCYVDRLRESYEEGCGRWKHFHHHSRRPRDRPLRVVSPPIDPQVLQYIGGEEIYSVCRHVPTYWVVEIPHDAPRNGSDIIYL